MEALMSKRHRKSKEFQSFQDGGDGPFEPNDYGMYVAPKGKKLKGRDRRKSIKHAFYDDWFNFNLGHEGSGFWPEFLTVAVILVRLEWRIKCWTNP